MKREAGCGRLCAPSLLFHEHGTRLIFHAGKAEPMKVFPFTKEAQTGLGVAQGHRASQWQSEHKSWVS